MRNKQSKHPNVGPSDGYVPLHPILAQYLHGIRTAARPLTLHVWHSQTPYGKDTDFVFPSLKAEGRVPLSPSAFVADHLRKAAKAAGCRSKTASGSGFTICVAA
jgi:hypothetical protein